MITKEQLKSLVEFMNNYSKNGAAKPPPFLIDLMHVFLKEQVSIWFNNAINNQTAVNVQYEVDKPVVIDLGFTGQDWINKSIEDIMDKYNLSEKMGFDDETKKWILKDEQDQQ